MYWNIDHKHHIGIDSPNALPHYAFSGILYHQNALHIRHIQEILDSELQFLILFLKLNIYLFFILFHIINNILKNFDFGFGLFKLTDKIMILTISLPDLVHPKCSKCKVYSYRWINTSRIYKAIGPMSHTIRSKLSRIFFLQTEVNSHHYALDTMIRTDLLDKTCPDIHYNITCIWL